MRCVTVAERARNCRKRRVNTRRSWAQLVGLVLVGLLCVGPAHALRCNGRLVTLGDHQVEVLDRCGEPAYVSNRSVYPYEVLRDDYRAHSAGRLVRIAYLPILVEEWVYDLGSSRFRQLLLFRDGRLVAIESIAKPR